MNRHVLPLADACTAADDGDPVHFCIAAELLPDAPAWQALGPVGWLLAFSPWLLRSAGIYLTPRADGQAG